MKIILYFLLFLIFNSCSVPVDEREMERVRGEYVKEQLQKYNLIVSGLGAAMFDKIREIKVYFISYEKMQLSEARKFFLRNVEDLINKVNSDIKIRLFLFQFPFSYKNADIDISFREKNHKYVSPPYIAFIFSKNGKIYYCQNDPITNIFIDFHEESIEEAKQILKEQDKLLENNI